MKPNINTILIIVLAILAHFIFVKKFNGIISDIKSIDIKNSVAVAIITGYSSDTNQTDSTPMITAYMTRVRPGLVAVSWDLKKRGWIKGKCVWIDKIGVRKIDDIMSRKWKTPRIDIWFHKHEDAVKFGVKRNVLTILLTDCGNLK